MNILMKICLTMLVGGGISLIIFQMIFDKGDRYTSPLFARRWQEITFEILVFTTITPMFVLLTKLIVWIFTKIWEA